METRRSLAVSSKVNASLVEREVEHCREQHEKPEVCGSMVHEERRGGGDRSGTEKVEGVPDHTTRAEFGDRCASRLNQEEAHPSHPPFWSVHLILKERGSTKWF